VVDLNAFAQSNSLILGNDVRLTFQQYDDFPFPSDGFAFDNISVIGVILPVELLSFDAQVTEQQTVRLDWATAQERNSDRFTVERSTDGQHFVPIGELPGAGHADETRHYQLIDQRPQPGLNYYRLWQTDFDGQKTASDLVSVRVETSPLQAVFPNPMDEDHLQVRYRGAASGPVTLRLIDGQGRVLREAQPLVQPGINDLTLPVQGLAPGLYLLEVHEAGARSVQVLTRN
jgi:hypothetical protein